MSEVKCPDCGTIVRQGNFCKHCGAPLQETTKFDEATAAITSGTASIVDGVGKLITVIGEYTDQKIRSVARRKEVSDVLAKVNDGMKKASDEINRVAKEVQDKLEEERKEEIKKSDNGASVSS